MSIQPNRFGWAHPVISRLLRPSPTKEAAGSHPREGASNPYSTSPSAIARQPFRFSLRRAQTGNDHDRTRSPQVAGKMGIAGVREVAFLATHGKEKGAMVTGEGKDGKPVQSLKGGGYSNPAASAVSLAAAKSILASIESCLSSDSLDADLAKCAILADCAKTPRSLKDRSAQSLRFLREILSGQGTRGQFQQALGLAAAAGRQRPTHPEGHGMDALALRAMWATADEIRSAESQPVFAQPGSKTDKLAEVGKLDGSWGGEQIRHGLYIAPQPRH